MRFSNSLVLAAILVVTGTTVQATRAQENSAAGKVAASPTAIEVTSPFVSPSRLDPELAKQFDARVIEYVEKMLRDYDANKNGQLDKEELQGGKWATPPEESDSNKDGALSKLELCLRTAKRFGLEVPVAVLTAAADAKPVVRKLIAFEFVIIERSGAELVDGKNKTPTAAQLLQLEKDGKAGQVQRLKLTALENVEARLQLGEDAPFISSRSGAGGARGGFGGQESVTYNSLGTTLTLTAETEADGKVLASISLARSTVAAPPKAAEKPEGQETGVSANYPRRISNTILTTLRVAPGETAVFAGQQTHTGSSPGEFWVLVSAEVK